MSTADLICQYMASNAELLEVWAPDCLRNPIPFDELTVDSTVFDPEALVCGSVKQCPSSSILRFYNAFFCEECGAGTVPDAAQKACVTCPPGQMKDVNGSACVLCPSGMAKYVGKVSCSVCPRGFYAATEGTGGSNQVPLVR
eukprot:4728959-Amphidinium_carterae.4